MRKYISVSILSCLLLLSVVSCGKGRGMQLRGEVSNIDTPYVLVSYSLHDTLKIDTVSVDKDGRFSYANHIDTLTSFTLYFNRYASSSVFFADKDQKLTIKGDADLPDLMEVRGNAINEELTSFKQRNAALLTQRGQLLNDLMQADTVPGGSTVLPTNEKMAQINAFNHELTQKAEDFIKANPSKLSSIVLINDFFFDSENPKALDRVLGYLEGEASQSPMAALMKAYSEKINQSAEGARSPFFKLTDTKDKTVQSSDFNGKYLLLSFVSSAGSESRENLKTLKTIYPKLNKDSVAFVSVYIDTDIYPVSYAASDSLSWTVVPEKKSWASEIVDKYDVQFVPYNILITPEGIIKDRNIPSQEVQRAVKNSTISSAN
ncbi:MAG: DUF4369 domain-containing protein [Dysgonamonadaceae bacterium]|jgi:peroxiredoxin|nr:DUF4369 domain-containing protein [Dysgonamonadaceae bacterium]